MDENESVVIENMEDVPESALEELSDGRGGEEE